MLTTAAALGLVFSTIFHLSLAEFLPLVVGGLLVFFFVGTPFTDGPDAYLAAAGTIKAYPLPFSFHIFRLVARSLIVFAHNLVVFIVVRLIFAHQAFIHPMFIVGLLIATVFVLAMTMIVGIIGARFKDVRLLIPFVWQIVFYLTPVIWKVDQIHDARRFIFVYNPFYYLLEVIRTPLMGHAPSLAIVGVGACIALGSLFAAFIVLALFRKRIALWV